MSMITMRAGEVGFALKALGLLRGRKPVMLAWRIGQITESLNTMQQAFVEAVRPYVDAQGGLLEGADVHELDAICNEEVTLELEPLRLEDLESLEIDDEPEMGGPGALMFLQRMGLVCPTEK